MAAHHYRPDNNDLFPHDFMGWLLFVFLVSSMTLFGHNQGKLIGIIMACAYTLYFLKDKRTLPTEIIILFFWILWSTTGYFVSLNTEVFIEKLFLCFQIAVMSFTIAGITSMRGSIRMNFFALIIGGILLMILSVMQKDFLMSLDSSEQVRFGGITENSNLLGWNLIVCIISTLYFLGLTRRNITRIMLMILIALFIVGIVLSGSRKMFIGVVTLMTSWWLISYYKNILKKPYYLIILVFLLIGISFVSDYMINNTYMGNRFKEDFVEDPITERREQNMRVNLYIEGFKIIKENISFGVGLGNFRFYSTDDHDPHTDYIEIIACGGIIAFILYFSIYVLVWLRLTRIVKIANEFEVIYTIGVLRAALITMLIVGFARPHFDSQLSWVLISSAIGYSWSIENRMKNKNKINCKLNVMRT